MTELEYSCSECESTYKSDSGLRRHRENNHPDSFEYNCPSCSRGFGSKKGMRNHHTQVHGESLCYEKVSCENPDCDNEIEKHEYWLDETDTHFCSEKCMGEWLSNGNSPMNNPKTREKMAQSRKGKMTGEDNPMTKKSVQKNHPILNGEKDGYWKGKTGEDHPMYNNVEAGKKISESKKGIATKPAWKEVEKTGHKVRSNWEKEIDILLYESGVEYEYEPTGFLYSNGRKYYPDFIVNSDCVIEVKGWAGEKDILKAEEFMERNPEYRYIVVGAELPCDLHIPWENHEELTEVIQ